MQADFKDGLVGDNYVPHNLARPMTGNHRFELGSAGCDWKVKLRRYMGALHANEFIRRLRKQEDKLELIFQPVLNRWVLYRVIRPGGCEGQDLMSAVYVLQSDSGRPREPGLWLIRKLQESDRRRLGANNDKEARQIMERQVADERQKKIDDSSKRTRDLANHAATNIVDYAFKEKRHILV